MLTSACASSHALRHGLVVLFDVRVVILDVVALKLVDVGDSVDIIHELEALIYANWAVKLLALLLEVRLQKDVQVVRSHLLFFVCLTIKW